jgi:hypothetical protein
VSFFVREESGNLNYFRYRFSRSRTEDFENKLREAEMREEALLKRITEKDKTIAKMR